MLYSHGYIIVVFISVYTVGLYYYLRRSFDSLRISERSRKFHAYCVIMTQNVDL